MGFTETCKKREYHLDVIGGILISYMIYTHCVQLADTRDLPLYGTLREILYFFMAWFFFKAGMFHSNRYALRENLKKYVYRLLLPYVVFTFIAHVLRCVFNVLDDDWNWIHWTISPLKDIYMKGAYYWNAPLWFLLTLFMVKVIYGWLSRLVGEKTILLLSVGGGVISCYLGDSVGVRPFWIANILSGLFFYGTGNYMANKQYDKIIFFICSAIYILSLFYPSFVDMRSNCTLNGSYLLWLTCSIAACIVANNFFKYLKCKIQPFCHIGEESMFYYVIHWPVIYTLYEILQITGVDLSPGKRLLLYLLVCIVVIQMLRPFFLRNSIRNRIGL